MQLPLGPMKWILHNITIYSHSKTAVQGIVDDTKNDVRIGVYTSNECMDCREALGPDMKIEWRTRTMLTEVDNIAKSARKANIQSDVRSIVKL